MMGFLVSVVSCFSHVWLFSTLWSVAQDSSVLLRKCLSLSAFGALNKWDTSGRWMRSSGLCSSLALSLQRKLNPGTFWIQGVYISSHFTWNLVPVVVPTRVQLFEDPWTVAHQAPLSMRFPRQEYWSMLPFPSPWYLSNTGIEPVSTEAPAL